MAYRLFPILTLADDQPYHPVDPDELTRFPLFSRGVLLALLVVIGFAPALFGGAIWDDESLVLRNPLLGTTAGLGRVWLHPRLMDAYRPVTCTLVFLERAVFGAKLPGYHVVSLLLHLGNTLMLWKVLRRLEVPGAWLAAAVFGVHPMTVQSVAWIQHQANLLGAAFYLGSIWTMLTCWEIAPPMPAYYPAEPPDTRHRGAYALGLFLFLGGLLSHVWAASVPVVLVGLHWWRRGSLTRRQWRSLIPFFATAVLVLLGMAWITLKGTRGDAASATMRAPGGVFGCILFAGATVWFYGWKALAPYPLPFAYARWDVTAHLVGYAVAVIAALVVVAGLWSGRRRIGRGPVVGAVFFVLALVPSWVVTRHAWYAVSYAGDHFAYLALVVPAVLASAALVALAAWLRSPVAARSAKLGIGTALVVLLTCRTFAQANLYRDEVFLWRHTMRVGGNAAAAQVQLGLVLLNRGKVQEAVAALEAASAKSPDDVVAAVALAGAYERQQRWDEAIAVYDDELTKHPGDVDLLVHLGQAHRGALHYHAAVEYLSLAARLRDGDAVIANELGTAYEHAGHLPEAAEWYRRAVSLKPMLVIARINLAQCEFKMNHVEEAGRLLQAAVKLDPNNANAYINAGAILTKFGRWEDAAHMFEMAAQIDADSSMAFMYWGMVLAKQRRYPEAAIRFQRAVELDPKNSYAQQALRHIDDFLPRKDEPTARP